MDKICVFPHKEDIADPWKNKSQKYSSAVVMLLFQAYSLKADKTAQT